MSGTSCPNCDAPATRHARRCGRCGYDFVEEGEHARGPIPRSWLTSAVVLVVLSIAVTAAVLLAGGRNGDGGDRGGDGSAARIASSRTLELLSDRPLATRAVERRLEERFTAMRDDDSAAVRCSEREAKPAHSIRRCSVRYPSGAERMVVLLTNARGNEIISERR